jgi:hypothetical protein
MGLALRVALMLFALLVGATAGTTAAEEIRLVARHRVGDTFSLALDATTHTRALSRSPATQAAGENVQLRYDAGVVILAVDSDGRSLRERHQNVRFRYERPDGSGSLLPAGTHYELRRRSNGSARIFVGDERLDRRRESLITALLASQFEATLGPELLEPVDPVSVGDSWALDAGVARRFLRQQGLRILEFGAPASATLERVRNEPDAELRIRYEIPIARLELTQMPPNARTAVSDAHYRGELRLGPSRRLRLHTASLAVDLSGSILKRGVATSFPFALHSSKLVRQQIRWPSTTIVSGR